MLLGCLAGGAASAGELAVHPPPGHTVEDAGPTRPFDEAYAVQSTQEKEAGCILGFQKLPTAVSQQTLNEAVGTPDFTRTMTLFLKLVAGTVASETVEQQGVRGLAMSGNTQDGETVYATVFVTQKGRTVASCLGPKARFDALRPEFQAIVRGAELPK